MTKTKNKPHNNIGLDFHLLGHSQTIDTEWKRKRAVTRSIFVRIRQLFKMQQYSCWKFISQLARNFFKNNSSQKILCFSYFFSTIGIRNTIFNSKISYTYTKHLIVFNIKYILCRQLSFKANHHKKNMLNGMLFFYKRKITKSLSFIWLPYRTRIKVRNIATMAKTYFNDNSNNIEGILLFGQNVLHFFEAYEKFRFYYRHRCP